MYTYITPNYECFPLLTNDKFTIVMVLANGVLCDIWGFLVPLPLFCMLGLIHSQFYLNFSLVVLIIIFLMRVLLFVTFYWNCRVILFWSIVKANYWGEDTAYWPCHTISQQSPYHVSDSQSQQRLVLMHEYFHLAFVKLQTDTSHGFHLVHTIPLPVPLHKCYVLTLWPVSTLRNLTTLHRL